MEELGMVSKRKVELCNIWKLMKLQFFMQRYYYLAAVCIMLFFAVSNVFVIVFDKGRCDIDETVLFFGTNVCNVFCVLLLILFFAGNNFLGNERISMYPGTVRSRVAARVIADYFLILTMVLWEVIVYLLSSGLLYILTKDAANINTDFVFSWDYLVSGMLEMLFVSMALYSVFILGYAVITRLGTVRSTMLFVAGVILIYMLISFTEIDLGAILEFFEGYDISFGMYLLRFAGLWLISTVLTWLLVFTVRTWKRSNAYIMWVFLITGAIGMPILIFEAHNEVMVYEEEELAQRAKERLNYSEPELCKDSVIEKSESLQENFDLLDDFFRESIASAKEGRELWFTYGEVMTVDQAKKEGYVESDFILPENGMVMRITATAEKCNEKFLYEGLVQNLEIVKAKGKFSDYRLEYRINNYGVVFPATLTKDYARFWEDGIEVYELDGTNHLSAILIVDDELKKAYDEREEEE